MNSKKYWIYLIGGILFLFGIYLSVFQEEPHFYTFFSLGLLVILFNAYKSITKKKLFRNKKELIVFSLLLIAACVIIDQIGMYLGYWTYQYETFFDNVIKYVFEWAIPLVYFMLSLFIGQKIFQRKLNKKISFLLSLIFVVGLLGLFTEYINLFSDSWIVLKMPITSYKIGEFFVIFQTLGYWLMPIVSLVIYKIVCNYMKKNNNFYVVEGVDTAGKTSISKILKKRLDAVSPEIKINEKPDKSVIYDKEFYRRYVKKFSEKIKELLKENDVVQERYIYSNIVNEFLVEGKINKIPKDIIKPDKVIYLTADLDEIEKRFSKRKKRSKRESVENVKKMMKVYEKILPKNKTIKINTTNRKAEDVVDEIIEKIKN